MSCSGKGNKYNFYQSGGGDIVVTLYKAEWCGHCKNFSGEWKKFQKKVANLKNVQTITVDADENPEKVKADGVKGYPTIRITRGESEEYKGPRTAEALMEYLGLESKCVLVKDGGNRIMEDEPDMPVDGDIPPQCGGGRRGKTNDYYKMKYLKYKAKYMLARSRLQN